MVNITLQWLIILKIINILSVSEATMPCWYFDKREIRNSPSLHHRIEGPVELRYRREGARFIMDAGTKMGLYPLYKKEREMFYLTTHSTHFIYGYMASGIWLRTILIVRKENHCRHIGYSYRLTARVLLYAPSHRQDTTYHSLCYTSRGTLAGTRNSSMGPPHEGLIRRPIAP